MHRSDHYTDAFDKMDDFNKHITTSQSFKPTGELIASSRTPEDDATIEIYRANASNPAIKQLLSRLQILNLFYIDGGTALHSGEYDSGRWIVYIMYHKGDMATDGRSPYKFVGFSTVYAYHPIVFGVTPARTTEKINIPYPYPADFVSDLPVRARISQFVILPPYQHSGHGAKLYAAVYKSLLDDKLVFEITVEDPSEAFDDLRDLNDLAFLRTDPVFEDLKINIDVKVPRKGRIPTQGIINCSKLDSLCRKYKIAPRQFQRVVEMHLLSKISTDVRRKVVPGLDYKPSKGEESIETKRSKFEYRLWCLLAKQRLYKHNRDTMVQMPKEERVEKLEETLYGVEMDYVRLLRKLERGPGKHPEDDRAGWQDEEEDEDERDEQALQKESVQVNVLQGKKRSASNAAERDAKKAKN